MTFDALAVLFSLTGSMFLRLETITFLNEGTFYVIVLLISIGTVLLFVKIGMYRAFMRYISTELVTLILIVVSISACLLLLVKQKLALLHSSLGLFQ